METLQIEKANAVKAFNEADASGKKMLTALFGEKVLSLKITDRVKSFSDACIVLGLDEDDYNESLAIFQDHDDMKGILAFAKLSVVIRALNEGWKPDWSKTSQGKYYPYFKHKSGSGLSYDGYVNICAITTVGSRLCFKSAELALYAGQQFEALYQSFFNL